MLEAPQIVNTNAQRTAVIRFAIPRSQIREVMGPGHRELMEVLAEQGIALAGPWFTHHLRIVPNMFDLELGVPVSEVVKPKGRVQPGVLPARTVVRAVYRGGYEGLGPAWSQLASWMKREGHTAAADLWESYLVGPETNPDVRLWRTELNRPLAGQARVAGK